MNPMSSFDPDQPSQVHDAVSDRILDWPAGWAHMWSRYAVLEESADSVHFLGLILDGWKSMAAPISSERPPRTGR